MRVSTARNTHSLTRRSTSLALRLGQRSPVGEVEAQVVGSDQRTGLTDAFAQHLAQRGVQQMGRRVVALGRQTMRRVDSQGHFLAHFQLAADHCYIV